MDPAKLYGSDIYNAKTCKEYNIPKQNVFYVLNGFKKCIYLPYKNMDMHYKQLFSDYCVEYGDARRKMINYAKEHNRAIHEVRGPLNVKGEEMVDPMDGGRCMKLKELERYYNITPFIPFLCINISPDWKAVDLLLNKLNPNFHEEDRQLAYAKILVAINQDFAECSKRFSKYNYAVECGKTGKHVHSHAVGQINPDMLATVITQKNKGNLARSIRTLAKGGAKRVFDTLPIDCSHNGWQEKEFIHAIIKSLDSQYSIQINIIRKRDFLQEKLDYLIEELKPMDHKNKSVEGFPIIGDLELIRRH